MTALVMLGVVPAKAGTQVPHHGFWTMDARFRGHDGERVGVSR